MEDKEEIQNDKELAEIVEEIFNLTSILHEYCKNNIDTHELKCLYTGLNILYKKTDDLNLKLMGLK